MPVMNGYEATRIIKGKTDGKDAPIIALTASAFEEDKSEILSAGFDDFIRKPFREAEIIESIGIHLGACSISEDPVEPDSHQCALWCRKSLGHAQDSGRKGAAGARSNPSVRATGRRVQIQLPPG